MLPPIVLGAFTGAYLAGLTSTLTANILSTVGRRIRKSISGPEGKLAIKRCVRAGIAGLLCHADIKTPAEEALLGHIFEIFFKDPDVARELSGILSGKSPDMEEVSYLFEEAGFDEKTLPAIKLGPSITAFEAAFLKAAALEPVLQPVIQTNLLLEQTLIQRELLESMGELVDFLKESKPGTIGIKAGTIIAENVVSGNMITYNTGRHEDLVQAGWEEFYLKRVVAGCDHLDLTTIDEAVLQGGKCDDLDSIKVSDVFTTLYLKQLTRYPDQSVPEAILKPGKHPMSPGSKWERTGPADGDMPISAELLEAPGSPEERGEKEAIPIQAIEAAGALPRLVILGRPGGGKSTLVNHISTQLALLRLGKTDSLKALPHWPEDKKTLPVRIILRQFAAWIPEDTKKGTEGLVWDYLKQSLKEWGCEESFSSLKQTLDREGGVVFFDGLDEVHETDADKKRSLIIEALGQFARPLEKCSIIVTCREYAYLKGDAWRMPESEFPVVELDLFREEQIEAFTTTWYKITGPRKEWSSEQCLSEAQKLFQALRSLDHLKELAQYPLLLTLITQVHGRNGYLPRDRADLYERVVNLLLSHWENRIIRDKEGGCTIESGLVMKLGIRVDILREALEKVALSAHERQEKKRESDGLCADIPKEDLREELAMELKSLDRAEEVMEYIQNRAGLLQARDNRTFSFPHRTFQEYLAATGIMRKSDCFDLLRGHILRDQVWWQEVFLLAAGSSRNTPTNIYQMVDTLLPLNPDDPDDTGLSAQKAKHAQMAAGAFHETEFLKHVQKEEASTPGRFFRIHRRVQKWLVAALQSDKIPEPKDRVDSGSALSLINDPRPEVMTTEHMEFCFVPGGPFIMGDDKEQHQNDHLDYDYWMGRHPVTNAQYFEFVKAGGYTQKQYWPEAGKAGYWKSGKFKGRFDPEFRDRSYDFGSPFNLSNHPVVGVSWYEALAFTRWLTEKWLQTDLLDHEWMVRLPSEAEWEKAARGGVTIPRTHRITGTSEEQWGGNPTLKMIPNPNPIRLYPWGDNGKVDVVDKNRANLDDTAIETTNAAGCFPKGAGPYGCLDMSGNIWEWTRSLWGKDFLKPDFKYPYTLSDGREDEAADKKVYRLLRGGSFDDDSSSVRCSARFRFNPDYWFRNSGFRVVVSPNHL